MQVNVGKEVAAMQEMPVAQLRSRYAEVFSETTNARNKQWQLQKIIWRLQSMAEGDLSPRINREECALLDAASCRAMFCHNEWYRDLIAKHRGPTNQLPIVLWPYPIVPWPGEPLSDEYDLLIYAKNGHRPQLLEHLAELYPRHIQIHYGRYRREELFEAARRSRACAYLDAVVRAQNLDRHAVRTAAEQEFSSETIVERVIAALNPLRALAR